MSDKTMNAGRSCVSFMSAVLLMVMFALPAAAQSRQGFSFGLGAGIGGADVTCDDCSADLGDDVENGPTLYVKGGLGLTRAAVKIEDGGFADTDTSDIGWGYQFGAGWDIPLGGIAITPEIAAWAGRIKEFEGLTGWKHAVVQATIGITFP